LFELMITADRLVVLKEVHEIIVVDQTKFRAHHFYRASPLDEKTMLVYGEPINNHNFKQYFETAQERILRDFEKLGIIVNGKIISKTAFAKKVVVHNYSGYPRSNSFKVGYLYIHPKEIMYAFMPFFNQDTKANTIRNAYQSVLDIIDGRMDCVDENYVQFANCGIPISMSSTAMLKKVYKEPRPFEL